MKRKSIQFCQRVPVSLDRKMRAIAEKKKMKRSELIREALLNYVQGFEALNGAAVNPSSQDETPSSITPLLGVSFNSQKKMTA